MPSIGAQTAAILAFIGMVIFIGPLITAMSPASFSSQYVGPNSITNNTYGNFKTSFQIPVIQGANSTGGFNGVTNILSQAFSPLAFIYGLLGSFWTSLTHLFPILYSIFSNLLSPNPDIAFLPVGLGAIVIIICFSYIMIGDFYKLFSLYMKGDIENVGS